MPTFRSNSSAYTNLTVTIDEIARGDGWSDYRLNWSVTTGSATALGTSSSNWRNLRLYTASGALITEQQIKASTTYWHSSKTYSGAWTFRFGHGQNNAGTASVYVRTNTDGTQSCIWTQYCPNFDISYSLYSTDIGTASGLSITPGIYENTVTLKWSKAPAGINNALVYQGVRYKVNGVEQTGIQIGLESTYTLNTSGIARGATLQFAIRTYGERNMTLSGYSGTVTKNRAPNQPTSPTVPKTSYIPGDTIRVSFTNTGDADGNLSGFEVATDQNETIVGTRAGSTVTYVDVSTTGWAQGIQRRFRVRGYDAFGIRSAWSTYTATVTLNTTPNAPSISYPAAGSTVYNRRPRILAAAGATNDGPKHILCLNDGTEKTTALNGSAFSSSTNDSLASGRKVVYVPPSNLTTGSRSISARMYDSFLYSGSVSRSFTIATLSVTDPNISTAGMKIKAVHITQLQAAINTLRAAYGYSAYSFTTVTAGVTPIGNAAIITQMQTALQNVIDRINGWDSNGTFDISVSWINPAAAGGGVDRVKLRQAIEQIRSIIPTI